MTRHTAHILLFALVIVPAMAINAHAQPQSPDSQQQRERGFTWWNDVPALIEEGNEAFEQREFDDAELRYRDARVLKPDEAVTSFNLGLARARQGDHAAASSLFDQALSLARERHEVREPAHLNLGVSQWNLALETLDALTEEGSDRETLERRAIEHAINALDSFDNVLRINPQNEEARHSKTQVQHFLREMATMPPPPPPQQQQQQGDGQESDDTSDDQQQEGESSQDQQQQEDGQDQSDPSDSDESQQDQSPDDGQGQDEEEQEQDSSDDQQQQEREDRGERPENMTEEQARQLLNLLGDDRNVVLRKSGYPQRRATPEKDW